MRNESPSSPFLTTEQLAERWGIPVGTVLNMRSRGEAQPAFRMGRGLRFPLADIEAFEQARMDDDPLNQRAAA